MIFYFTGTGNSLYAAKSMAAAGEKLISMAEQRDNALTLDRDGESVGFFFPVYYYTVNDIVADFTQKLTLNGSGYTYAVVTCGASIGGCGALLRELLAERGIVLDAVFPLVMTDNAMLYYNISDAATAEKELAAADEAIKTIAARIAAQEKTAFGSSASAKLSRTMYHAAASTKKYYSTDKCTGCGKCASNCPEKAIEIRGGRPMWVKAKCALCMGCINRCPVGAIEYGKRTVGRNRYENKKAF